MSLLGASLRDRVLAVAVAAARSSHRGPWRPLWQDGYTGLVGDLYAGGSRRRRRGATGKRHTSQGEVNATVWGRRSGCPGKAGCWRRVQDPVQPRTGRLRGGQTIGRVRRPEAPASSNILAIYWMHGWALSYKADVIPVVYDRYMADYASIRSFFCMKTLHPDHTSQGRY